MNHIIIKEVGTTYQAGTLITDKSDFFLATNLYLASQAGIQSGQHILDAGCGSGGPSIDIAKNIKDIKINAITISIAQEKTAKKLVQQDNLTDIIKLYVGDYHYLPFADNSGVKTPKNNSIIKIIVTITIIAKWA